jgi:two-component system, OmpR family, alkaline phosphatase synthesis response regulator PhoP
MSTQCVKNDDSTLSPQLQATASMSNDTDIIEAHGIVLHPATSEMTVGGRPVTLTKTEFGVLRFLIENAGTTHTRQQIIEAVHGPTYPVTERSVDSQVVGLRRRLSDYGRLIESVRGVGYRFRGSGP